MQSHRGVDLLQATQNLNPPEVYARPPQLPQLPLSLDVNKILCHVWFGTFAVKPPSKNVLSWEDVSATPV